VDEAVEDGHPQDAQVELALLRHYQVKNPNKPIPANLTTPRTPR
jgi:hypothetical protein